MKKTICILAAGRFEPCDAPPGGLALSCGAAPSPFGLCHIAVSPFGICHLSFTGKHDNSSPVDDIRRDWPEAVVRTDHVRARELANSIFQSSCPPALLLRGTAFQLAVWRALLNIPEGETTSYGKLAASLGHPRASRAVGTAVGANRIAWLIPCHRVLRGDGSLGGYRWGPDRKRAMLERETARI
ncbi:MAG: methylated-DNA--[protein]-cysteine S-methyltransferase [Luteolibacter sp.]